MHWCSINIIVHYVRFLVFLFYIIRHMSVFSVFLIKWTAIWKKNFAVTWKSMYSMCDFQYSPIIENQVAWFFWQAMFLFHTVLSLCGTSKFHGNNQLFNWELVWEKKATQKLQLWHCKHVSRWGLWDQNTFCCYCCFCFCCFLSVFTELWYEGKCVWIMTTDEIQMW